MEQRAHEEELSDERMKTECMRRIQEARNKLSLAIIATRNTAASAENVGFNFCTDAEPLEALCALGPVLETAYHLIWEVGELLVGDWSSVLEWAESSKVEAS